MKTYLYVGVDLGGKFHQVQVTSSSGERVGRAFRIGRGHRGLAELLEGVRARSEGQDCEVFYTVEATQNFWLELVHPLVRSGVRVYLVSPAKSSALRTFYRRHTKTDAIDAGATSQVPLVDPDLHPVFVGSPRFDALRRLVRQYWQLKTAMSDRKRRIISRVLMVYPGYEEVFRNRYCGASLLFCRRYLVPSRAHRLGRKRLEQLLCRRAWGKFSATRGARLWEVIENAPELDIDYEDLQFLVNQDLDLLEAEERSKTVLKERIAEVYSEVDPELLLQTHPGLGEVLAAGITAFVGEQGRFDNANQAVAFSGIYTRKKASAGSETPNQRLSRQGDPTLRSILYVAAEVARHYDPELQAFHRRLTGRGKHYKQASCALAAKILRRCFAILRDRRPYQVTGSEILAQAKEIKGKRIRQSVSEVAERLNDALESTPLTARAYASATGFSTDPNGG